jgi:hypothetical protein
LTRLPLVKLTQERSAVRQSVLAFRRAIEVEILQAGGGGIAVASRILASCVAFRRHLECERRLSEGKGTLTLADWLSLADRSVKWSEAASRALTGLGLDRQQARDVWAEAEEILKAQTINGTPPPAAALAPPQLPDATGQGDAHPDRQDAADAILDAGKANDEPGKSGGEEGRGDGA